MKRIKKYAAVAIVCCFGATAYCGFRFFGVNISTTREAFALPAEAAAHATNSNEFLLDATPAPWPEEARSIYRLVSWGIPVHVNLLQANEVQSFTIQRINAQNHMVIQVHDAVQMKNLQEAFK
jgi:hypothetical protein